MSEQINLCVVLVHRGPCAVVLVCLQLLFAFSTHLMVALCPLSWTNDACRLLVSGRYYRLTLQG